MEKREKKTRNEYHPGPTHNPLGAGKYFGHFMSGQIARAKKSQSPECFWVFNVLSRTALKIKSSQLCGKKYNCK